MQHQKASERLVDLVEGRIEGKERDELQRHLDNCDECREWTSTWELFSQALAEEGPGGSGHPSSEQLATYSVDPELLTAPERQWMKDHIAACISCRRETSVTAGALTAARDESARPSWPVRLALAASLILALTLGFVVRSSLTDDVASGGGESAGADGRPMAASTELTAQSLVAENGTKVTLRAAETVILADGFSVAADGNLTIEISDGAASGTTDTDSTRSGSGPGGGAG